MKHVRTYQRAVEDAQKALAGIPEDAPGRASLSLAIGLLSDLTATLPAIVKREKAQAERIQWVEAPNGVMVAKVGRRWSHYSNAGRCAVLFDHNGAMVARFEVTSIEGASRAIRRWRKKQ